MASCVAFSGETDPRLAIVGANWAKLHEATIAVVMAMVATTSVAPEKSR